MVIYLSTKDLAERLSELEEIKDSINDLEERIDDIKNEISLLDEDEGDIETYNYLEEKLDYFYSDLDDLHDEFNKDELEEIEEIERSVPDFHSGVDLIPEDDFNECVREYLVEDTFPDYIVIDWEATADNLLHDYSPIDYQGDTYLYRS